MGAPSPDLTIVERRHPPTIGYAPGRSRIMNAKRYLIVGDGAAGTTAAQELRRLDPYAAILIVSDDPSPSYYRAALTNYLLGELREEQIWAVPPTFYAEHRVERRFSRIGALDAARGQVLLTSGGPPLAYDALLVASG